MQIQFGTLKKWAIGIFIAFAIFVAYIASTNAAPAGYMDIEFKLKPPTERDLCLNPFGETEATVEEKQITCLEWQPLPSDEISHYQILRADNQLVTEVQHVPAYVDYIFYDGVLPFGEHNLIAYTYDTDGRRSRAKTFTMDVVMPTGDPKSLMEFSAKQKVIQ